MRVVLRSDVDKLGKRGDMLDVADGYARNYLLPRAMPFRQQRRDRPSQRHATGSGPQGRQRPGVR